MGQTAHDLGTMSRIEGMPAAVGPMAGETVVDIGCGEGEVARAFAGSGATVLGFATGRAALLVDEGRALLEWTDLIYAMDLDAMNSSIAPLLAPVGVLPAE